MYKVRKITDRVKNVEENTLSYLNKTEQYVSIGIHVVLFCLYEIFLMDNNENNIYMIMNTAN